MRHLRRKLPLNAHGEQVVFVKRKQERIEPDHRVPRRREVDASGKCRGVPVRRLLQSDHLKSCLDRLASHRRKLRVGLCCSF